jgi:hypothetical protein
MQKDKKNPYILHPIDELSEEDGNVILWHVPIEEPPIIGHCLDPDIDEELEDGWYTHFSYLPEVKTYEELAEERRILSVSFARYCRENGGR